MFTDGETNEGPDPVATAKSLYGKHGSNLCIHVVSYADSAKGQQVIDGIRALSGCSVAADAKSLESDAAMAQFAKAVLYDEVQPPPPAPKPAPAPAPAPAPKPVPVPVAKQVVTFNLLFGFDKSAITDEMIPVLEQAKIILEEDATVNFVVSGHTDSTGPEAYNQKLSERRAASVKNWLVSNGIPEARLEAVGYGETQAKYDNNTREGRKLNRRVEMQSK
jgi:OOP family OmpA-OmpF porin